jgi:signal peptidase I
MNFLKKFWTYLKKDTWDSWLVSLVLIIILIRFIVFPILSLLTGSALPLVVVESCSMYHSQNFESWWEQNSAYYESLGIKKSEFENFPQYSGLNKGDILLITSSEEYKKGDIIIFQPNPDATSLTPIIHRIIKENPIGTKGDNNPKQLISGNNINDIDETNIPESRIIGKTAFKVLPFVGWIKLIFFEPFKPEYQRGFC